MPGDPACSHRHNNGNPPHPNHPGYIHWTSLPQAWRGVNPPEQGTATVLVMYDQVTAGGAAGQQGMQPRQQQSFSEGQGGQQRSTASA